MNIENLTPAPWVFEDSRIDPKSFTDGSGEVYPGIIISSLSQCYVPEGVDEKNHVDKWPQTVLSVEFKDGRFEEEQSDIEFICLARNAFDVMMRRRWTAIEWVDKTWGVVEAYRNEIIPKGLGGQAWPDPFTALVEADKWYVENVK